eukprot:PhM_4_TR7937/c0_g1_i2/m.97607
MTTQVQQHDYHRLLQECETLQEQIRASTKTVSEHFAKKPASVVPVKKPPAAPAPPQPTITETMRHKLMEDIAELYDSNPDAMVGVIDVIQSEAPSCLKNSSEGMDLDLEPLQNYAAFKKIELAVQSKLKRRKL